MKFTIRDKANGENVKLDLTKHPQNTAIYIVDENTKRKLISVECSRGKIGVKAALKDGIVVGELSSDEVDGSPGAGPVLDKIPDSELRNWEIAAGMMKVQHPRTNVIMELPLGKGATMPASPTPDILGQPEMTFSVAFAIKYGIHSMLIGPTGTGKTSVYRWFAEKLGYNFVTCPIARGTEASHMIGEYAPTGPGTFEWMDGPVTTAIRLSQKHPTILVFDELNRIGNIAEFSRIYSVLDDTKRLELNEKRTASGATEVLEVGELYIGATANPSDDAQADYIGVQDLDPALASRFAIQPLVMYPEVEIEVAALLSRVDGLAPGDASKMAFTAKRIRESEDVRFPISFRELMAWGQAIPSYGYRDAARVAVVNKAPRIFRQSIENLITLGG